ncbi:MAG: hypothetical protein WA740_09970 [Candidatus Binataceae bacterium]
MRASLRISSVRIAIVIATLALLAGCAHRAATLPESGSPAAVVYQQRCGQCHAPYNPRSMTSAMWSVQVDAMQLKMRQSGIAPLTDDQRQMILDYLTRNAGTE